MSLVTRHVSAVASRQSLVPCFARSRRSVLPPARSTGEGGPPLGPPGVPPPNEQDVPNLVDPFRVPNPPKVDVLPDNQATKPVKETMAWYGPAPETVNGRLAMLGFVAALGAELATGTPLWRQVLTAPLPIAVAFGVLTFASLVPIWRGADLNASNGPFTKGAELINGRVAMFGLVGLAVAELLKGGALFAPPPAQAADLSSFGLGNDVELVADRPRFQDAVKKGADSLTGSDGKNTLLKTTEKAFQGPANAAKKADRAAKGKAQEIKSGIPGLPSIPGFGSNVSDTIKNKSSQAAGEARGKLNQAKNSAQNATGLGGGLGGAIEDLKAKVTGASDSAQNKAQQIKDNALPNNGAAGNAFNSLKAKVSGGTAFRLTAPPLAAAGPGQTTRFGDVKNDPIGALRQNLDKFENNNSTGLFNNDNSSGVGQAKAKADDVQSKAGDVFGAFKGKAQEVKDSASQALPNAPGSGAFDSLKSKLSGAAESAQNKARDLQDSSNGLSTKNMSNTAGGQALRSQVLGGTAFNLPLAATSTDPVGSLKQGINNLTQNASEVGKARPGASLEKGDVKFGSPQATPKSGGIGNMIDQAKEQGKGAAGTYNVSQEDVTFGTADQVNNISPSEPTGTPIDTVLGFEAKGAKQMPQPLNRSGPVSFNVASPVRGVELFQVAAQDPVVGFTSEGRQPIKARSGGPGEYNKNQADRLKSGASDPFTTGGGAFDAAAERTLNAIKNPVESVKNKLQEVTSGGVSFLPGGDEIKGQAEQAGSGLKGRVESAKGRVQDLKDKAGSALRQGATRVNDAYTPSPSAPGGGQQLPGGAADVIEGSGASQPLRGDADITAGTTDRGAVKEATGLLKNLPFFN